MSTLRYGLIAVGLLGVVGFFGTQIKALETIKGNGQTVLLALRPADPRALMMGDFMALRYAEERNRDLPKDKELLAEGQFILTLDENKVGSFSHIATDVKLETGEIKLNYIRQRRGVTFGAPRYYFQNGTAQTYETAAYGIFKVAPSGRAILTGLADESFKRIDPPKN